MKIHEFTIIASGLDPTASDFESRFFDRGCDDATISFQRGHIILDFARSAASMEDAISTALEAVEAAGATVERVEPDPLVSLADIAARAGMSRAAISLYAKGRRGRGFPPPIARVTSETPLWDWAEVALWLHQRRRLSRETVDAAQSLKRANSMLSGAAGIMGDRPIARRRGKGGDPRPSL